jgi:hypothetical protein
MAPRVSIITALYNHEAYVAQAIESVLAQTYGDYELILWDDGSQDRSLEIARSYVRKYPQKVFSYTHPGRINLGQEATRNEALKVAGGEYLCLLDSDDYWLPRKLEQQVAVLDAAPQVGLVYGPIRVWIEGVGEMNLPKGAMANGMVFDELVGRNFIHACDAMFRRECIKGQAEPFQKQYKTMGEYPLWLNIAKDWQVAAIDQPLAVWRVHGHNTGSKKRLLARRELAEMAEGLLRNPGYSNHRDAIIRAMNQYRYDLAVWLIEEEATPQALGEAVSILKQLTDDAQIGRKAKVMLKLVATGKGALKAFKLLKTGKNWLLSPRSAIFEAAIRRSQQS